MAFYVPVYLIGYGPQNFLWLSSITLILGFLATILESRFLASMAAVGGLAFELLWAVDFLFTVSARIIGSKLAGFTIYVFDPYLPIWLKVLALYHLALPPLLIWLFLRLGYDTRAWIVQIFFSLILMLATWFFTSPFLNINFVFSYLKFEQLRLGALPFLTLLYIAAVLIMSGTHLFLKFLNKRSLSLHH